MRTRASCSSVSHPAAANHDLPMCSETSVLYAEKYAKNLSNLPVNWSSWLGFAARMALSENISMCPVEKTLRVPSLHVIDGFARSHAPRSLDRRVSQASRWEFASDFLFMEWDKMPFSYQTRPDRSIDESLKHHAGNLPQIPFLWSGTKCL